MIPPDEPTARHDVIGRGRFEKLYWRAFNFAIRRILAVWFIIAGTFMALVAIPNLLPGATIQVDGRPSDDMVLRVTMVLLPLILSGFGIAFYRAKPYEPKDSPSRSRDDA